MDNFEALDAKNAAISLPDGWAWARAATPSNTPGLLWIDYDGRVIRGAPCGPTPIGDEDGWPGTFGGRRGWVRPLGECRAPPGWYVAFEHASAAAWTGFQFVTPDDAQYGEPIVPDDASCWQWVADADSSGALEDRMTLYRRKVTPTPGERTVADVQGVGISARGTPLELEYDFEGDDVGVDVTNAEAAEWRRKGGCE